MRRLRTISFLLLASVCFADEVPRAPGKFVDLGGHRLHVHCTGKGSPTVVVEPGFDEFSTDWILVQDRVSKFTRICTYDRAGYAWSDPGPEPRTYSQINLELHDALAKLKERGPFIFVGHSFGGPVIWNYAKTYPNEVAGLLFAEAVGADHRIIMGKKTARIADFASHKAIPAPHENMTDADRPNLSQEKPADPPKIDSPFDKLPAPSQQARLWALAQPSLTDAENSEREWSPEYLAYWLSKPQAGTLGSIPIIVLARKEGGYSEGHDLTAEQLERERRDEHAHLAALSSHGEVRFIETSHEIEVDAPDAIANAITELIQATRKQG